MLLGIIVSEQSKNKYIIFYVKILLVFSIKNGFHLCSEPGKPVLNPLILLIVIRLSKRYEDVSHHSFIIKRKTPMKFILNLLGALNSKITLFFDFDSLKNR